MLPAPTEPVPVVVGGVSEAALRRAARNDGWVSDLHTIDELGEICRKLHAYRAEIGRDDAPFAIYGSARDAWDLDGYRRLADVRSEEHTSELQSLMRNSYAVYCLKKKKT